MDLETPTVVAAAASSPSVPPARETPLSSAASTQEDSKDEKMDCSDGDGEAKMPEPAEHDAQKAKANVMFEYMFKQLFESAEQTSMLLFAKVQAAEAKCQKPCVAMGKLEDVNVFVSKGIPNYEIVPVDEFSRSSRLIQLVAPSKDFKEAVDSCDHDKEFVLMLYTIVANPLAKRLDKIKNEERKKRAMAKIPFGWTLTRTQKIRKTQQFAFDQNSELQQHLNRVSKANMPQALAEEMDKIIEDMSKVEINLPADAADSNKPPEDHKVCGLCGSLNPSKTCGQCRFQQYCSAKCQAQHWPLHRPYCLELAKALALAESKSKQPASASSGPSSDIAAAAAASESS